MPLPAQLTDKLDSRCTILGADLPIVAAMTPIARAMIGITVERIARMMDLAPSTAYRPALAQQMIRALAAIDDQRPAGERPNMSPRDRARLLMLRRPLPEDIDEERVRHYVVGVAMGVGVEELAERVAAVGAAELIRRLLRYTPNVPGCEGLRNALRVADVMEA